MKLLDVITIVAFAAAILAFPYTVYTFGSRPIRSVLVFVIPMGIFLAASDISQEIAQNIVLDEFDALSERCQVSINATPVANPKEVLLALKTLHWLSPHHSSPTKQINVELSDDSRHIVLSLARDSNVPREYWVYYPEYYITRNNEIGRIVTPLFDNY